MSSANPRIVHLDEIRRLVDMATAVQAARAAFALANGDAVSAPSPWHLPVPQHSGELHVKGAYVEGSDTFAVKMSAGFPRNVDEGLPTATGFTSVFDARTGILRALLLDDGYLTELRTGAAGALAADIFCPPDLASVTILGAGGQAKFQLEGIFSVRQPSRLVVWARQTERADALARWAAGRWPIDAVVSDDVNEAVKRSRLVVTVTASTSPLFDARAVMPGTHVTAVGADTPGKRELPPELLASADVIAVDDAEQSARLGELQGITISALHRLATLSSVLGGVNLQPDAITVADLSGLGIQDSVIAATAWTRLNA